MSAEKLTTPTITNNSFFPSIKWYGDSNFCLVFKGSCLKQKNATDTPPNRIIFFIVYELDTWSQDLNSDFTLKYCLFGGVKLAKNADPDKYVYSRYGIGFNSCSEFSLLDGGVGKMFLFFKLIRPHLCILIIKKRYLNFWYRPNTKIRWYYFISRSSIFNYFFNIK